MVTIDKLHLPERGKDSFHCPTCGVHAEQKWFTVRGIHLKGVRHRSGEPYDFEQDVEGDKDTVLSVCARCRESSLWIGANLVFPERTFIPPPNSDLNKLIQDEYNEAASVLAKSPRAAATLLRRATERLCSELVGEDGKNNSLATNICLLEKQGILSPEIIELMHTLRIAGNHASHPQGFQDEEVDKNIARALFNVINDIVDAAITKPNN